ncbi:hypothetical protein [Paenibacillus sp. OAE614]|uniref:hypothetical protein n=1 Tax=Paenibacillus sp. OAE614 TaxID=2663804 RepID=UPI001A022CBC
MKKIAGILLLSICIATGCESHKPSADNTPPADPMPAGTVNSTEGINEKPPATAADPPASTPDAGSHQPSSSHDGEAKAETPGRLQSSQLMFGYLDAAGSRILEPTRKASSKHHGSSLHKRSSRRVSWPTSASRSIRPGRIRITAGRAGTISTMMKAICSASLPR